MAGPTDLIEPGRALCCQDECEVETLKARTGRERNREDAIVIRCADKTLELRGLLSLPRFRLSDDMATTDFLS